MKRLHLLTLCLLPYFTGCGLGLCIRDQCFSGSGAHIVFSQPVLDYGVKAFGTRTGETVVVSNSGAAVAEGLSAMVVTPPFFFVGGVFPGTGGTCTDVLETSTQCTVEVEYRATPPAASHSGSIQLAYSGAQAQMPLLGEANKFQFRIADGFAGTVYALAVSGARLYVGGDFEAYGSASAQRLLAINTTTDEVDPTFDMSNGFNGTVRTLAVALDGSGDLYVGGEFTTFQGVAANRIIRLNADGSRDAGFNTGAGCNNWVYDIALATDGSFDVYATGSFTTYAGAASSGVVRINANGSRDAGFAVGAGLTGFPRGEKIRVAVDGSNDVYVAGSFTHYAGASSNNLVRINSNGSRDAAFNVGTGFNNFVWALGLALDGTGKVYVGGLFSSYQGGSSNLFRLRLNPDGTVDGTLNYFCSAGWVSALHPVDDGSEDVYVAATLSTSDGAVLSGRAGRVNSDGCLDATFASGINGGFPASFIYAFATDPAWPGEVFVGGFFDSVGGSPARSLVRLRANGSIKATYGTRTGFFGGSTSTRVLALLPLPDGNTLLGGSSVYNYDSLGAGSLIRLHSNAERDIRFTPFFSQFAEFGITWNNVSSLAVMPSAPEKVYVGGYNAGGRLARLNFDGTADTAFDVGTGPNHDVYTMAHAVDRDALYIGGAFAQYNGSPVGYIARVLPSGARDTTFATGAGFNNAVLSLVPALDGTGSLYIGGGFSLLDGGSADKLVKLLADGTRDPGFSIGSGFSVGAAVYAIALVPDGSGKIYVGGRFSTYNGSPVGDLMRLNSDGSLDGAFSTGAGFSALPYVYALLPCPDGKLYVGGTFTSYDGTPVRHFVRVSSTGAVDASFDQGVGFSGAVRAIAFTQQGNESIVVGGDFRSYNGETVDLAVRLLPNGQRD